MMTRLALVLALATGASMVAHTANAAPPKSLYDQLGGKDAVKAVVHDFLGNVAADTKINSKFGKSIVFADPKKPGASLEEKLNDQICAATGGGCTFKGKSMKDAHAGMKITEDEFNALVADLIKSLDKFKVAHKDKNDPGSQLLAALGGMKGDIVGK